MKNFKNFLLTRGAVAKDMRSNPMKYKEEFIKLLRDFTVTQKAYNVAHKKYFDARQIGDMKTLQKYETIYKVYLSKMDKINTDFFNRFGDAKNFYIKHSSDLDDIINNHLTGLQIGKFPINNPEEAFKKWFGLDK